MKHLSILNAAQGTIGKSNAEERMLIEAKFSLTSLNIKHLNFHATAVNILYIIF